MRIARFVSVILAVVMVSAILLPASPASAARGRYPIIFVPGIGGSYLELDPPPLHDNWKIWVSASQVESSNFLCDEVLTDSDLCKLRLTSSGTPTDDNVWLGDIIRSELPSDVYGPYMNFLSNKGYAENFPENDYRHRSSWFPEYSSGSGWLSAFPYDFRRSIEYNAGELAKHVNNVLKNTGADKVILTAHSTGGLVARTYIVNTSGAHVAGLIAIATPWLGSPMLTKAMLTGWDFDMFGMNQSVVRELVLNWPGAHGLGPGPQYQAAYGDFLYYENTVPSVLVSSRSDQLAQQQSFNRQMYDDVQVWRTKIFNGNAYGVSNHVIAGHLLNQDLTDDTTMIKYEYRCGPKPGEPDSYSCNENRIKSEGDNTVPLKSGFLGCSWDEIETNPKCDDYIGHWTGYLAKGTTVKHGDITGTGIVHNYVSSALAEIDNLPVITVPAYMPYAGEDLTITATFSEAGAPLAGKTLTASFDVLDPDILSHGLPQRLTRQAVTDANGRASFTFPHVGYYFSPQFILNSGGANTRLRIEFAGDGETAPSSMQRERTLRSSRYGTIIGKVVEALSGTPLPWVRITVLNADGTSVGWADTASNGTFAISTFVGSNYRISTQKFPELYVNRELTGVQVSQGFTSNLGSITLTPIAPNLSYISPAGGNPAGGTSVTLSGEAFTWATGVQFGTVPATSINRTSDNEIVAIAPPGTGTVDVIVTSPFGTSMTTAYTKYNYLGAVSGVVRNSAGQPVQGATVKLMTTPAPLTPTQTQTDASGRFSIQPQVPGAYFVEVTKAGFAVLNSPVMQVNSTQPVTAEVTLMALLYLTVAKTGDGTGTVSSNPAGISCGNACTATFTEPAKVVLTGTPGTGYFFGGWQGCDSFSGNTCTVTMSAARTVTANFTSTPPQYTVNVSKSGTGGGTVTSSPTSITCGSTCSGGFNYLTSTVLTAAPDSRSIFAGWQGCVSADGFKCTVGDAATVTATFNPNPAVDNVSVSKSGNGSGTVTSAPEGISCGSACAGKMNLTTPVVLTATADAGSTFGSWQGCDSITGNQCTVSKTEGTLDAAFNPSLNGSITHIAAQSDGKTIIAGTTLYDDGMRQYSLARLNADGSVDTGFEGATIGASENMTTGGIGALAVLSDGKVLVSSYSTTDQYGWGYSTYSLSRLDSSGFIEMQSDPGFSATALAVQSDGKVIAGGGSNLVRLSGSGSTDYGFNPQLSTGYGTYTIDAVGVQGDGKILVGRRCDYSYFCGYLTRINSNGSTDPTFTLGVNGQVNTIVPQADGKMLLGGAFTSAGQNTRNRVLRLNADGTLDGLFAPEVNGEVKTIAVQPDGRILIGGDFTTVGGETRNRIARLNSEGSLDSSFNPGASSRVRAIAVQADGKVVFGGDFSTAGGQTRNRIARIASGTRSVSVTASFTLNSYRVTVNTGGLGTVASTPSGITCSGTSCSGTFLYGTSVTLAPAPGAGSAFTGWSGGTCSGSGNCTFTVGGDTTLTATFAAGRALTVTLSGAGTGSVNSIPSGIACATGSSAGCSSLFAAGSTVTLTKTPSSNSAFGGWGGACSGTGACQFPMDAAKSVTATFTANAAKVKIDGDTRPFYSLDSTLAAIIGQEKTVLALTGVFVENVQMNSAGSKVLLKGGFADNNFISRGTTGTTVIDGSLKIRNGLLRVERLIVR